MKKLNKLAITAVFASLICVVTFAVRIPSALGYIHPGDGVIYLAACILPFPYSIFAAAIGGGLVDFLTGFPQWIIPNLIIKSLITLPFSVPLSFSKNSKILTKKNAAMTIPAGLITIGGYFVACWILYGREAAIFEISENALQAGISAVLFIAIAAGLDKIGFKRF